MKHKLLFILWLLAPFALFGQAPSSGLVAYYPFNGNANDESGNSRNGVVTGATLAADRFGQDNKAYTFNGTNNSIRVTPWNSLTSNSARSMSIWYKTSMPSNTTDRVMLWWGVGANNVSSWIGSRGNFTDFGFYGYGNECVIYSSTSFDNRWHHIVFTYDGVTKKLWLDGALVKTTTAGPLNTAVSDLYIGSGVLSNSANYFYQGQLDDIRIYNRGLSETEVLQLYQAEAPSTSAEFAKIGANRFIHTIGLYNTSIGNMAGNTLSSSAGTNNAFIGYQTGKDNSTGSFNSFIGYRAGFANTTGSQNTLIGAETGYALSGSGNTMLGYQAGKNTSTGASNTFIGPQAGLNNTTGSNNIIIGPSSGTNVTTGNDNILMGYRSKSGDGRGSHNLILGSEAGGGDWSGMSNTLIGYRSSADSPNLQNATAIGANAHVSISDAVVLGNNVNVGIGTSAPLTRLHIVSEQEHTSGLRFGKLTANSPVFINASKFLTLDDNGDVVLGSQFANSLRLQIASTSNWPDYVFKNDYRLRSLAQLEVYIKENNHLPNLPSAEQMDNHGETMEELIKGLVKNQEEQTRYLIELKKENQQLRTLIDILLKQKK